MYFIMKYLATQIIGKIFFHQNAKFQLICPMRKTPALLVSMISSKNGAKDKFWDDFCNYLFILIKISIFQRF